MEKLVVLLMTLFYGYTAMSQSKVMRVVCKDDVDTTLYDPREGDAILFSFPDDDYLHYREVIIEKNITWYAKCRDSIAKTFTDEKSIYFPLEETLMKKSYDSIKITITRKSLLLQYANWTYGGILMVLLLIFATSILSVKEDIEKGKYIINSLKREKLVSAIFIALVIAVVICYFSFVRTFGSWSITMLPISFLASIGLTFFLLAVFHEKRILSEKGSAKKGV